MQIGELRECLELFLDKKVYENLKNKLTKFEEDSWLIEYINSKIGRKDMRNLGVDDFVSPLSVLDNVVTADYPIENPVLYSPLYRIAIENNELPRFKKILAHLNKIGQIEKSLVSLGIQKNSNFGKRLSGSTTATEPRICIFEEASYLGFMESLLSEDQNIRRNMVGLDKRLTGFESYLQDIKNGGIDLNKLFLQGYTKIIKTLDSSQNKGEVDKFQEASQKVIGLIKRLDSLGLDIYLASSINSINKWLTENKLNQVNLLADYLSKEAIMYVSSLHLKKD